MKLINLNVFIGITLVLIFANCGNNNQSIENKDSLLMDSISRTAAFTYNQVSEMQDSLLEIFSWPGKHELDLNDDGIKEEFLAIEGYSRGMGYTLFCKEGTSWKLLSGDESIASGHLGINKLDKINGGWHDFVALQPSGRNGVIESYYTWNGKNYSLKEQKEVEN